MKYIYYAIIYICCASIDLHPSINLGTISKFSFFLYIWGVETAIRHDIKFITHTRKISKPTHPKPVLLIPYEMHILQTSKQFWTAALKIKDYQIFTTVMATKFILGNDMVYVRDTKQIRDTSAVMLCI